MNWTKKGKCRWLSDQGHTIIKYRMLPGEYSFLLYQPGEPLEYGDYTGHDTLKDAKKFAGEGLTVANPTEIIYSN